MKTWVILVRREFWENRSLWIAPLASAGFLLVSMLAALLGARNIHVSASPDVDMSVMHGAMGASANGIAGLMLAVASLAIGAYLIDCLYAERRDRSILFWKSLPVSDAQTVLSKFIVAMVVVPLGVYVAALCLHLLGTLLLLLFGRDLPILHDGWSVPGWFALQVDILGRLVLVLLWYAPLAAYLMLASVVARKVPMLTAVLPPLVLAVAERLVLGTSEVTRFLIGRLAVGPMDGRPLTTPGLWLGLVATAGMLLLAIRLRRYRDDT
jgi:ABC-2 type transport system permease protein